MRTAGVVLLIALFVAGCNSKSDASAAPDPAALKAQQDLIARRQALLAQRRKLEGERDRLDAEIEKATASGSDTTELVKQRVEVVHQIETQSSDLSSISSKLDQVVAQGDAAAGVAARLANKLAEVADREASFTARERAIAQREAAIAQREATLAQREKETCGVAAPTILQVPTPRGGSYARRDVDPLLSRARKLMARKGLLPSDLGPAARLESEATDAMKHDDWSKAYLAAAQLAATIEAIKIDRNFIAAKTARLKAAVNRSKRSDAVERQLADGMAGVMQRFGDGNFTAANAKLNQLWALVR